MRIQEPTLAEGGPPSLECTGAGLRPGHRHATALRNILQQLQDGVLSVGRLRRATRMGELERYQMEKAIRDSEEGEDGA
eukprot:12904322-Alexandrium_andersonii.AAC.1